MDGTTQHLHLSKIKEMKDYKELQLISSCLLSVCNGKEKGDHSITTP